MQFFNFDPLWEIPFLFCQKMRYLEGFGIEDGDGCGVNMAFYGKLLLINYVIKSESNPTLILNFFESLNQVMKFQNMKSDCHCLCWSVRFKPKERWGNYQNYY